MCIVHNVLTVLNLRVGKTAYFRFSSKYYCSHERNLEIQSQKSQRTRRVFCIFTRNIYVFSTSTGLSWFHCAQHGKVTQSSRLINPNDLLHRCGMSYIREVFFLFRSNSKEAYVSFPPLRSSRWYLVFTLTRIFCRVIPEATVLMCSKLGIWKFVIRARESFSCWLADIFSLLFRDARFHSAASRYSETKRTRLILPTRQANFLLALIAVNSCDDPMTSNAWGELWCHRVFLKRVAGFVLSLSSLWNFTRCFLFQRRQSSPFINTGGLLLFRWNSRGISGSAGFSRI